MTRYDDRILDLLPIRSKCKYIGSSTGRGAT